MCSARLLVCVYSVLDAAFATRAPILSTLASLPVPLLDSPIEALPVPLLESPIDALPVPMLESPIITIYLPKSDFTFAPPAVPTPQTTSARSPLLSLTFTFQQSFTPILVFPSPSSSIEPILVSSSSSPSLTPILVSSRISQPIKQILIFSCTFFRPRRHFTSKQQNVAAAC